MAKTKHTSKTIKPKAKTTKADKTVKKDDKKAIKKPILKAVLAPLEKVKKTLSQAVAKKSVAKVEKESAKTTTTSSKNNAKANVKAVDQVLEKATNKLTKQDAKLKSKSKKTDKKSEDEFEDDLIGDAFGDSEIAEYEDDLKAVEDEDDENIVELSDEEDLDQKDEEVYLTDSEGRRLCKVRDCDQAASVEEYCRYHYLLLWKKIQIRKSILNDGKLEKYVDDLTSRYPDKFLEVIRKDLKSEKDFLAVIQEMELDENALNEIENEDEVQSFADEIRGIGETPSLDEDGDY
jgi:hypothetical protein